MRAPLVVFGEDWGAHPSSTQHLIRRLMRDRSVVWINSIGLRRPKASARDLGRIFQKGVAALSQTKPARRSGGAEGQPDAIVSPFAIPVPRNRVERAINRAFLGRKVRCALGQRPTERPILWTSLPTAVDHIGCVDERAVIYYCGDDFSGLAGVDHDDVTRAEERLAKRADLILAASERLADKFPAGKTVHLPHGVDTDLFSAPAARPTDLPEGAPVAGFYGSISDWMDVEMMDRVVTALPDWRFVFIGNVQTDVSLLERHGNVIFLGSRAHHELPGYVQNWTVSLLPFRDNAQIRACNPLKLREYLSAGTSVVTTDFPALDGYRDLVSVADGAADFASAIENAAREPIAKMAARRHRVAGESWDARALHVGSLLAGF